MTHPDDATRAQIIAADPARSTWLSANAGSGKTRVLTDRVALLLLGGADPRRILCLTYTKAAAGEMQNRLFKRLGQWAMLGEAELRAELARLGVAEVPDLRKARTLFAQAIETPGGLKIQTIHSFCSALLRRYPLEAGVSPRFTEADETSDRQLMAEVAEALADGPEVGAVDAVARHYTGADFEALLTDIVRHADVLRDPLDTAGLFAALGIPPGLSEDAIVSEAFTGSEPALLARLVPALRAGSVNDRKAAGRLAPLAGRGLGFADLEALEGVLLTGESGKKGAFVSKAGDFPTKATRATLVDVLDDLDALMDRIEGARRQRVALAAARKTLALSSFARAFLPACEAQKRARGWLSFDDLIRKARDLLSDAGVSEWVLYRLDGGIDHILVDEAQDTSPEQWQVVERLAQELIAGEGARPDRDRTLFVVGDRKQSIYSFQGADAQSFNRMAAHFRSRLAGGKGLAELELIYSFRSSTAILRSVDQTFAAEGRGGVETGMRHLAYHGERAGRVDLWPLVEPVESEKDEDWEKPVDRASPRHHMTTLAGHIADGIKAMIDAGETVPGTEGGFRRVTPGDILILVQSRGGNPSLFDQIIRALKVRRLPVAGADRLKLRESLAVRDLEALLSVLALPEDSLSLATVLRSPLCGWSEAELHDLAAGRRDRFLWQALRERRKEFPGTWAMLDDLKGQADFLRPYDLLERALTRHHGRERLLVRLGAEAEDGIDELLNLALSYERNDIPSLTGFLSWLQSEDTEIKRQLESAGGRIRVMTVHGSKGLESPVVILPDTLRRPRGFRGDILHDGPRVWWAPPKAESPDVINAARAQVLDAEAQERERLLYVAMTRAESWLIVCGAGKPDEGAWYPRLAAAIEALEPAPLATPAGPGSRFQHGDWDASATVAALPTDAQAPLPAWLGAPAVQPGAEAGPLSPSALGGAKALPGDPGGADEDASLRRGRQIHRLLEHFPAAPRADWPGLARALLSHGEDAASPAEADALATEVIAILDAPHLAPLFAPGALAEVTVTAELPDLGGRRILGAIDRLIVAPDRVTIVDFKSNAVVPPRPEDTPVGILRQMGAYAAALGQIYPDRPVETAILWTTAASLMPLPHDIVMAALRSAATS